MKHLVSFTTVRVLIVVNALLLSLVYMFHIVPAMFGWAF